SARGKAWPPAAPLSYRRTVTRKARARDRCVTAVSLGPGRLRPPAARPMSVARKRWAAWNDGAPMSNPGTNTAAGGRIAARQRLMHACSEAPEAELNAALAGLGDVPPATELRAPQTGLVMLRGRIGGNGAPFNVGEATVTRAAVQLES